MALPRTLVLVLPLLACAENTPAPWDADVDYYADCESPCAGGGQCLVEVRDPLDPDQTVYEVCSVPCSDWGDCPPVQMAGTVTCDGSSCVLACSAHDDCPPQMRCKTDACVWPSCNDAPGMCGGGTTG